FGSRGGMRPPTRKTQMAMIDQPRRRYAPAAIRTAVALCLLPLGACDFAVTNPGPVQDRFLDEPEAQTALINGMGRTLVEAVNLIAYVGGIVSREIHFAGQTGAHGVSFQQHLGRLRDDETGGMWNNAQQ